MAFTDDLDQAAAQAAGKIWTPPAQTAQPVALPPFIAAAPPQPVAFDPEALARKAAFYAALAAAQGAITNPAKNREVTVKIKAEKGGGQYKYKYTTLDEMLDVIRKPMADNGLSMRWSPRPDGGRYVLDSIMMHKDGHAERTAIPIAGNFSDMQGMGGLLSYARRYSIGMWFTMASDEDDDANAADGNDAEISNVRRPPQNAPATRPAPAQAAKPAPPTQKKEAPVATPQTPAPAGQVPASMDDPAMTPYKAKLMATVKGLGLYKKRMRVDDRTNTRIEVSTITVNDAIRPIIDRVGPPMYSADNENFVVARDMTPAQLIQLADSLYAYAQEMQS